MIVALVCSSDEMSVVDCCVLIVFVVEWMFLSAPPVFLLLLVSMCRRVAGCM